MNEGGNNSNGSMPEGAGQFQPPEIHEAALLYLIELVALFGNGLVVITICSQRSLKTNYYFLVLNLAVCDLILSFLCCLFTTLSYWMNTSGRHECILEFLTFWLITAESYFIVLIAVLRYRAVTNPFRDPLARKKLFYITALIYVVTFPIRIQAPLNCFNLWSRTSVSFLLASRMLGALLTTAPFLTAVVVLIVLYAKICYSLYLHNKHMKVIHSEGIGGSYVDFARYRYVVIRQKRNEKTVYVSIIIVAFFVVSSLPGQLIVVATTAGIFTEILTTRFYMWTAFAYLVGICTVNPVIYAFGDKTLLSGFKKALVKVIASAKAGGGRWYS